MENKILAMVISAMEKSINAYEEIRFLEEIQSNELVIEYLRNEFYDLAENEYILSTLQEKNDG